MNIFLEWFIVLVVAFILHEAGHYYFLQNAGFKPKFKFQKGGLTISDEDDRIPHPYIQLRVLLGGFLLGGIPIVLKPSLVVVVGYLAGSLFDFYHILRNVSMLVNEITKDMKV